MLNFGFRRSGRVLPAANRLFYTKTPNGTGANAGKYVAPAGNADCYAACPEFYTDVNTPLAFTGAELIAMQGHEWSWQFSTSKGLSIYAIAATFETINKARRYHKLALIYPRLAWGIGYQAGAHSQYGPEPAFASAGVTPKGDGTTYAQNVLPVDATGRGVYCGPGYSNIAPTTLSKDAATTLIDGWYDMTASGDQADAVVATYNGSLVADASKPFTGYWLAEFDSADVGKKIKLEFKKATGTFVGTQAEYTITSGTNLLGPLTITQLADSYGTRLVIDKESDAGYAQRIKPLGWFITQSAYTFPYIPPETTVTSCAGTYGDNGMRWTMDDGLIECLRGETDGTEIWNNATASGTNWALATGAWTHTAGSTTPLSIASVLTLTNRYLVNYSVTGRTAGSITARAGSSGTGGTANTTNASFKEELTCAGSTDIQFVPSTDFNGTITVTSILRLLPSRCTVAALVTMGVGSGELLGGTTPRSIVTCADTETRGVYCRGAASSETASVRVSSTDGGGNFPGSTGTWSSDEVHLKIVQTNRLGTQFRVGNRRLGIDSSIQWSTWATYDGSFNPLTVLRAAYNSTVPTHLKSVQAWDRPVTDSVIYDWATSKLGGGA